MDLVKSGQFGDMFGAFNSLVTSISLIIVACTFWLQKKAYEIQRAAINTQIDEMKASKDLIIIQKDEMIVQTQQLKRQAEEMERTRMQNEKASRREAFYKILGILKDEIESSKITYRGQIETGYAAFKRFNNCITTHDWGVGDQTVEHTKTKIPKLTNDMMKTVILIKEISLLINDDKESWGLLRVLLPEKIPETIQSINMIGDAHRKQQTEVLIKEFLLIPKWVWE